MPSTPQISLDIRLNGYSDPRGGVNVKAGNALIVCDPPIRSQPS